MPWLLGKNDGQILLAEDRSHNWKLEWERTFSCPDLVYGGFLSSHIENLEAELERFHDPLLKDFQTGWSAVALTVRGEGAAVGPFAAPTTARAHFAAPLGLYLLSANRLRASLQSVLHMTTSEERLELSLHRAQLEQGTFFCDPNLEVCLAGLPDFFYSAPTRIGEWKSALLYLLGRRRKASERAPASTRSRDDY